MSYKQLFTQEIKKNMQKAPFNRAENVVIHTNELLKFKNFFFHHIFFPFLVKNYFMKFNSLASIDFKTFKKQKVFNLKKFFGRAVSKLFSHLASKIIVPVLYTVSLHHILERELFCLGCLGSSGRISDQHLRVFFFSTFCGLNKSLKKNIVCGSALKC